MILASPKTSPMSITLPPSSQKNVLVPGLRAAHPSESQNSINALPSAVVLRSPKLMQRALRSPRTSREDIAEDLQKVHAFLIASSKREMLLLGDLYTDPTSIGFLPTWMTAKTAPTPGDSAAWMRWGFKSARMERDTPRSSGTEKVIMLVW